MIEVVSAANVIVDFVSRIDTCFKKYHTDELLVLVKHISFQLLTCPCINSYTGSHKIIFTVY